jgi:4-amino-4-deoxy-L-arabinose transferase-like glycosyltransferase
MRQPDAFSFSRSPLALICGLFVICAAAYAWATPIFEASDEREHFGVIQHIAETGQLPVQRPELDEETIWAQEGSQPPLYYLISAALVRPIDRSDFEQRRQQNPHARIGLPHAVGNKNHVLHDTPHPPLRNTALAVYLLRGFSIALGVATIALVYRAAQVLTPDQPVIAMIAAGITAFNPMFIFIAASVNNDNLVTTLNSAVIVLMLVTVRDGFDLRRSVGIALLVALAALTKLSGLVIVPAVALAGLWTGYRRRDWRGVFVLGSLMLFVWLAVAGWWYWRNLDLYGELFGTETMVAIAGPRPEPFTLATMLTEFEGFRITYWGLFGLVNILTALLFYRIMDGVTLIAALGVAAFLWRSRGWPDRLVLAALLALIITTGAVAVIQWTAQTYASQGRLLFPYMAATSPLLALGIWTMAAPLLKDRAAPALRYALAGLAAFAFLQPITTIAPEYAPPRPIATLPDEAIPVYARFDNAILIGYHTPSRRYAPGDIVPVTLYWQVIERSREDYSLYVHALDVLGAEIGKVDSYPGAGLLRTSTWQPGAIYADYYGIPLDAEARGRYRLRLQVGWWHFASGRLIGAYDAADAPIESVVLNAGGFAGEPLPIETLTAAHEVRPLRFGPIRLLGYTLESQTLTLVWEAQGRLSADYTVFVQALDTSNMIAAQGDAPPMLPTSFWLPGERYATTHILTPTGDFEQNVPYRLIIGWYNPEGGVRLRTDTPDSAYPLAMWQPGGE